ncbi:unnamed protein product [Thlaspi arvense]|uniref:Uncharacterized protein n=1 Tax=Thlaspi arvense TaxID=13288 RepID=A0AAU9RP59_THLAR|nr:unnamed protein product [Thlaspi arvense]
MERCTRWDMVRSLVEVDLHKQLTEHICFTTLDGTEVHIDVNYPWLPPWCNVCHKWGHPTKDWKQQSPNKVGVAKSPIPTEVSHDSPSRFDVLANISDDMEEPKAGDATEEDKESEVVEDKWDLYFYLRTLVNTRKCREDEKPTLGCIVETRVQLKHHLGIMKSDFPRLSSITKERIWFC